MQNSFKQEMVTDITHSLVKHLDNIYVDLENTFMILENLPIVMKYKEKITTLEKKLLEAKHEILLLKVENKCQKKVEEKNINLEVIEKNIDTPHITKSEIEKTIEEQSNKFNFDSIMNDEDDIKLMDIYKSLEEKMLMHQIEEDDDFEQMEPKEFSSISEKKINLGNMKNTLAVEIEKHITDDCDDDKDSFLETTDEEGEEDSKTNFTKTVLLSQKAGDYATIDTDSEEEKEEVEDNEVEDNEVEEEEEEGEEEVEEEVEDEEFEEEDEEEDEDEDEEEVFDKNIKEDVEEDVEEEFEVEEIKFENKIYYTNDSKNGVIFEYLEDAEIGEEIGYLKNGKLFIS